MEMEKDPWMIDWKALFQALWLITELATAESLEIFLIGKFQVA